MAQQVFNQWLPVAKAQNEQGQEVYLPFAGIHMQTRDGNDEVIVGAGNMVWTGSMWVPVSAQNRLPVEATLSGTTVDMATETTLAQAVDKLNSILSRLEGKLDTAIFDSQGNPISAANRLPVEATLSGRIRQVVLPRAVRNTSTSQMIFPAPPQARGAVVTLRNFGTTGQFVQGQGIALLTRPLPDVSYFASGAVEMRSATETSTLIRKQHVYLPGAYIGDMTPIASQHEMQVAGLPPLEGIGCEVLISGTFNAGQGFDCQVEILWLI